MSDTLTLHAAFAARVSAALDRLEQDAVLPAGIARQAVTVEPPGGVVVSTRERIALLAKGS